MPTATQANPKRPEYPVRRPLKRPAIHPGTLMREILEEHLHLTIAEAARRMGISRPALYAVLNGSAAVSAEMALRFARITGGAPELYLNMQTGYDLAAARARLALEGAQPVVVATSSAKSSPAGADEPTLSLSDATLRAVEAQGGSATAAEVMNYLTRELGMTVRANHLGVALARHRRSGSLENRDHRWFLPAAAGTRA
jgi:antitoxin HigA-1